MFDRKQEIDEAVESLVAISNEYQRGQTVPWDRVERIVGDRKHNRAKHVVGRWRRRLLKDRDIVTLCCAGEGVRLLTHRETAEEIPALRQKKAYRQVRRAMRETETVEVGALTDQERKVLAAQRHNMALQRRELFRSRQQLKRRIVTEATPRRRVPS